MLQRNRSIDATTRGNAYRESGWQSFDDHRDVTASEPPVTPLASDGLGNDDPRPDLAGRSVVCFPGPGPLDAAVAAMAAQLLRRAGCDVREQSRDRLRGKGIDTFNPGDPVNVISYSAGRDRPGWCSRRC